MDASPPNPSLPTPQELLAQTQSYLACRSAGHRPTPELEAAWCQFYNLFSDKIRRFACACHISETDLADCVQEVWRELLVRLPAFQFDPKRGKFDTWLYAIARNKTIDFLRLRRRSLTSEALDFPDDISDPKTAPPANPEAQERVSTALAQLRPQLSECTYGVLHLRLVEQQPVATVAEKLGLTHEQVWYRCHRAHRQLKQIARAMTTNNGHAATNQVFAEKIQKNREPAQAQPFPSVSRGKAKSGIAMDFIQKRLELGRQGTGPEWKVEWNGQDVPEPTLHVRKLSMVAYAEFCGPEEIINSYWPQITNAAITAGVAAGIATIIVTPTAAIPIFRVEFAKQLCAKMRRDVAESIRVALSAQQEANGPWVECVS